MANKDSQKSLSSKKKDSIFRVMVARIRHSTHDQLVSLAHRETERTGRQIYVADLVREAIQNYLRSHITNKSTLDGSSDDLRSNFQ
jgi:hypothetical protein